MNLGALLFSFEGRIGIRQFWLGFVLSIVALSAVGLAVGFVIGLTHALSGASRASVGAATGSPFVLLVLIAMSVWTTFAVMVKRCHDRGKSGLWALISLIPIAGFIWWLIDLGLMPGDGGSNAYGAAPGSEVDADDAYERIQSRVAAETSGIRPSAAPQPAYRAAPTAAPRAPVQASQPRPRREAPVFRPVR